jgi:hypothetical protein
MLLVLFSRAYPVVTSRLVTYASHRSIVGRPRHQGVMVGMGQKDSYVGWVDSFRSHLSALLITIQ